MSRVVVHSGSVPGLRDVNHDHCMSEWTFGHVRLCVILQLRFSLTCLLINPKQALRLINSILIICSWLLKSQVFLQNDCRNYWRFWISVHIANLEFDDRYTKLHWRLTIGKHSYSVEFRCDQIDELGQPIVACQNVSHAITLLLVPLVITSIADVLSGQLESTTRRWRWLGRLDSLTPRYLFLQADK